MITPPELLLLGDSGLNYAKHLGATECEIYLISGTNSTLEIKNNAIVSCQSQTLSNIGIRAFSRNSSGSISLTTFDKEAIREAVGDVVSMSKVAPSDNNFRSLLKFSENPIYPNVPNLYDSSITKFSEEDLLEIGEIIIDTVKGLDDRAIVQGNISIRNTSFGIVNSHGIRCAEQLSSSSLFSSVNIRVNDSNIGTGGEFWISRSFKDLKKHSEAISNIATDKALKALNSQKISESKAMPVIIHGRNAYSWLGLIIGFGISAKKLFEGESYFSDRLGAKVITEGLEVIDNPLFPGGFQSIPFDDEGAPTQDTKIINKEGILENFITDSYTSNILDLPITGHANRSNPALKTSPSIHQLHISNGDAGSIEDLIRDTQKGIYLESSISSFGLKGANISEKLGRAFYVEHGEIKYPIKDAMIAGNINTFLNGISGVSSDLVIEFGRKSPHILVDGLIISGAR
ncbi:MAG: TldD/PmbA family protein [Candidatus Thorarchaeota archaeon]